MTIEQKARAYDEALEIARDYYKANLKLDKADENLVLEDIFPELQESEDEKVKNELIDAIRGLWENDALPMPLSVERKDKWIAWLEKQAERKTPQWMIDFLDNYRRMIGCSLDYDEARDVDGKILCIKEWLEKQGEQKPIITMKSAEESLGVSSYEYNNIVDDCLYSESRRSAKVAPKFNEGEWITNGDYTWKIVEVKPLDYILQSQDDNIVDDTISHVDEQFHSFTIKDAKDGDVLVDVYGNIGIIQKYDDFDWRSYCSLGCNGGFQGFNVEHENDKTHPATKEQRDLLFAKMKEAGYEWSEEKKELRKIEQKPIGKVEPKFHVGYWIVQENIGTYKIIEVCESWYEVVDNKDKHYSIGFDKEYMCHLWTIKDAKDGDVLVASDDSIFLFAGVVDCACKYYAALTTDNYIKINKETKGGYWETSKAVYPATKEQRELLFQKMKEAGYEWDEVKKELRKIEDDSKNCKQQIMSEITSLVTDYIKQKPTWSEEDEHRVKDTIYFLDTARKHYASTVELDACIDWLKSLKQRIGG